MISTHAAQEIMRTTKNHTVLTLCETIVDLWRMFGEANCDAVMARDEIDALISQVRKEEPASLHAE